MAVTRALLILAEAGIPHEVHQYELHGPHASRSDTNYGQAVAAALGVEAGRVFKTLVAVVDETAVVGVIPVSALLSLKSLARAAGGKRAVMADPADAEKWTGYVVGGISPFGQKRQLEVFVDDSASRYPTIFVSAGQRGLQVEVDPSSLAGLLGARSASLT